MLVGEIGVSTGQFYYGLRWWEMKAIIAGYNRRSRAMWSATRWQTYCLMAVHAGKSMKEQGISSPADLLPFPWDNPDAGRTMSDEEQQEFLDEIKGYDKLNLQP